MFWFVSFQDCKWWVCSFCYCRLLGNVLWQETCVYGYVYACVLQECCEPNTCWCFAASQSFHFPFPGLFQGRSGKKRKKRRISGVYVSELSRRDLQRPAGPVSASLRAFRTACAATPGHRAQAGPQLSSSGGEEEKGGTALSLFSLPFFLKANAVCRITSLWAWVCLFRAASFPI